MPLAFSFFPTAAAAAPAVLRRFQPPSSFFATSAMAEGFVRLIVCGKSEKEKELAISLNSRAPFLKLTARGEGEEVQSRVELEVGPSGEEGFGADKYMEKLSAGKFGRVLVWTHKISSTHDFVSQNFSEIPLGTVCVADIQSKGRGRSKNVWESPPGCLLFSFTLEMEDGCKLPLLQYVVSLAVTEAIKEVCQSKGATELGVRIKWPNDLYLNGLKVGGILCTSTYRSKTFNVCAGIGLNVDNEEPTTCLNAVLRQQCFSSHKISREELLATFFNKFEKLFDLFSDQGFQVLEDLYYMSWLHSGQKVVIEEKGEGQLTQAGVTTSGYLLAVDEDNKKYELHPDGNRDWLGESWVRETEDVAEKVKKHYMWN